MSGQCMAGARESSQISTYRVKYTGESKPADVPAFKEQLHLVKRFIEKQLLGEIAGLTQLLWQWPRILRHLRREVAGGTRTNRLPSLTG